MKTVYQYIKSFYEKNKDDLQIKHPGLSLQRIVSELQFMFYYGHKDIDHFLKTPYFPNHFVTLENFLLHLQKGQPIQYFKKRHFFYDSYFSVNEKTLISRYETEILVYEAVNYLKNLIKKNKFSPKKPIRIVDVGTGPGNIILSIIKEIDFPHIEAYATDLSAEALKIAQKNYFNLGYYLPPTNKVKFIKTDRLSNIDETFDLIVSNPPYIKKIGDADNVHDQVKNYEPHMALFLEDEQYEEWFTFFFKQIILNLKISGLFLMEGHECHLKTLKNIFIELQTNLSHISILKDLNQADRFLKVIK